MGFTRFAAASDVFRALLLSIVMVGSGCTAIDDTHGRDADLERTNPTPLKEPSREELLEADNASEEVERLQLLRMPVREATCDVSQLAPYMSRTASKAEVERISIQSGSITTRIIRAGEAVADDHDRGRVNIFVDEHNVITRVQCG